MDPYIQAALLALLGGLTLVVVFFLIVPNFPSDRLDLKDDPPAPAE